MIKLIVIHRVSKRDSNGNHKYVSEIISTTKQNEHKWPMKIEFTTPCSSNSEGLVTRAGLEWRDVYCLTIDNIPLREFNRYKKDVELNNTCMDKNIIQMIKDLI